MLIGGAVGGKRAGLVRACQLEEDGVDVDEDTTVLESGAVDDSCRTTAESGEACPRPPATRRLESNLPCRHVALIPSSMIQSRP
mmetsp:Transcript_26989/g.60652  ORF Transcript_26989/g.60652 Transcript_26989/m.60652 type:complete len:84 (+) Transcript_26989:1413-1664(+)